MLLYIIPLLLSLQYSQGTSALCSPGRVYVSGNDVIEASRGRLLLLVYMPLQCSHCHRQLRELDAIQQSISELRIVIVAPGYEAPSLVNRIRNEFPSLVVERDEDGRVPQAGFKLHDQTLYDRCGRVSRVLSHQRGQLVSYKDTLGALESALHHAPCGWCQYDARGSRDVSRQEDSSLLAKNVNAYLKSSQAQREQEQRRANYNHQQQDQRSNYNQQQQGLRPNYSQQPAPPVHNNYRQQPVQNREREQQQQSRHEQDYRRDYVQPLRPNYNNQQSAGSDYRYQQQHQPAQHSQQYQPADYREQQPRPEVVAPYQRISPSHHDIHPTMPTSTLPPTTRKSIYSADDDYDDYGELRNTEQPTTTQATEDQIVAPMTWNPLWPTPPPANNQYQGMRQYQVNQPFGPIVSENNIPCSAYTDDICYQQQEKLGSGGLSKCCSKGIYFTDLCVPGKCTNSTVQLCCFQKFLQAKFSCCEDSSQSDGAGSTNQFSRCCHQRFVQEDECCTEEAATQYWASVHEVCYPNTKVDYSNVKMEVRFSEGVRVIDLGENRLWDYECRFGGNRIQFAYIP